MSTGTFSSVSGGSLDYVEMTRDSAQTVSNATHTKISLDTTNVSKGTALTPDPTTNNRIDVNETGDYLITARGGFSLTDQDQAHCQVYVDGARVMRATGMLSLATSGLLTVNVSGILTISSGSYIELYLYHSFGSNRDTSTGADKPSISVVKLS